MPRNSALIFKYHVNSSIILLTALEWNAWFPYLYSLLDSELPQNKDYIFHLYVPNIQPGFKYMFSETI